jgi:uncharacterized protein (TIGR00255 family)
MTYSMTGFGKAVCELPNKKVSIEIKSLNSKQLDLNTRIAGVYREKELILRNEISTRLVRGKIDLSIFVESGVSDRVTQINRQSIEEYHRQLLPIAQSLGVADRSDFLRVIMSLPDTVKTEQAEPDETEWELVMEAFQKAIANIEEFRRQEGAVLENEINQRIHNIRDLLAQVEPLEKERINKIRTRLHDSLQELAGKLQVDENRFEQELIFYLEKLDITEEKVRLANHLDYFNETMGDKEPAGKKLGFITQEIGREINTLGSKANDAVIQRLVIQMKDELEKIKEQSLNLL